MKSNKAKLTMALIAGVAVGAGTYLVVNRYRRTAGAFPSLSMRAAETFLRLQGKVFTNDVALLRAQYLARVYPSLPPIPRALRQICEIHLREIDGHRVFTLVPKVDRSSLHIIYTHGGAYINELHPVHWDILRHLIKRTGASVTLPIYPLAPESTYQATYSLLERIYRELITEMAAEQIVLCGDSAGGGLAVGQAFHYRDIGLPLPGQLILFSPWLDITMSHPATTILEKRDVMLGVPPLIEAGRFWAGGDDPQSPLLSPLFGNLSGLPPIEVYQGTHDLFLADARQFQERVVAAGGEIRLYEYPGAIHVFVGATFTPEAHDAYQKIASSLKMMEVGGEEFAK